MHKFSISVIMPAYNVGKYIGEAIESILNQSFTDFELIIVDDCSTDNTMDIVNKYILKYPQIRFIKREHNSGGCRLPRFDGILAAQGDFVCPVDSDDFLEKDYLLKLYQRQRETNSTLVLGRMIISDENGNLQNRMTPSVNFDFNTVESGKDACKKTIGGWEIALAGLLARTIYYQEYIQNSYHQNCNFGFADEIDHRRILLGAKKVAYVDAHYYYRQQPNSIIHNLSLKRFDIIKAYQLLEKFVFTEFSDDYAIQNKFCLDYLKVIYYNYSLYYLFRKRLNNNEQNIIENLLSTTYSRLKLHKIFTSNIKEKFLLKRLLILQVIARFRNIYARLK